MVPTNVIAIIVVVIVIHLLLSFLAFVVQYLGLAPCRLFASYSMCVSMCARILSSMCMCMTVYGRVSVCDCMWMRIHSGVCTYIYIHVQTACA